MFLQVTIDNNIPDVITTVGAERCANPRLPAKLLDGTNLAVNTNAEPLKTIVVQAGGQQFTLAIAQQDNDEELGLMCIEHLHSNSGMLFDLHSNRTATFWMKNTLVPLDILWTTHTGVVTKIEKDVPASKLSSRNDEIAKVSGNGRFVIELPADSAAAAGIAVGTKISPARP